MPTTLFTWELVVECSVSRVFLESQPHYVKVIKSLNIEAISAHHVAMLMIMVS